MPRPPSPSDASAGFSPSPGPTSAPARGPLAGARSGASTGEPSASIHGGVPRSVAAGGWQRVVGFDPGLNVTGYGVIDCRDGIVRLVEAGTVRSVGETLEARLATIHRGVREVLETLRPTAMAIEQVFVHARFPRTAILMGHARGVICLAAAEAGLPVNNYPPTRVKSLLTGSGHAAKEQMQSAVQRELGLAARPEPADVADALAVALADWHLRIRVASFAGAGARLPCRAGVEARPALPAEDHARQQGPAGGGRKATARRRGKA